MKKAAKKTAVKKRKSQRKPSTHGEPANTTLLVQDEHDLTQIIHPEMRSLVQSQGYRDIDKLPPEFDILTPKQKLFVIYYVITRNGTESARLAGYEGGDNACGVMASELLRNPKVLSALDAYTRPFFQKHGLTIDRTLSHLSDIAYSPWGDHVDVVTKKGQIVSAKLNLSAKLKALELHFQLLKLIGPVQEQVADQSQHIHLHNYKTADEARAALLDFLKKRK